MATEEASPSRPTALSGQSRLAFAGYAVLGGLVAWWAWRAFNDPLSFDTGLAYQAGALGWATGHPEHLSTWNGMTFLVATMALLSRVASERAAVELVTALNVAMVVGAVALVLARLRPLLSPFWWWVMAVGLMSFGPMMSSVWWKQFNAIALVLAVGGFELLRRGRVNSGAAAIGLSIAVKPLAILLPFVLLARRNTRRAGALAVAWVAGLNVAAQALMAARAGDLATLDPLIGVRNFFDKTQPAHAFVFVCYPGNFSPGSMLCRMAGGTQHWALQHVLVWGALALLGAWVVDALRGHTLASWESFAFTCVFSVMIGPLGWSHYQIMLAPLFVLLLVRFAREGAAPSAWAGLAVAFGLASLMWEPYGTIVGAIRGVFSARADSLHELTFVEGIAQFAQYVLLLTGVLWYTSRRASARTRVASSS